jgi:hypothetical protein
LIKIAIILRQTSANVHNYEGKIDLSNPKAIHTKFAMYVRNQSTVMGTDNLRLSALPYRCIISFIRGEKKHWTSDIIIDGTIFADETLHSGRLERFIWHAALIHKVMFAFIIDYSSLAGNVCATNSQ